MSVKDVQENGVSPRVYAWLILWRGGRTLLLICKSDQFSTPRVRTWRHYIIIWPRSGGLAPFPSVSMALFST